MSSALRCTFISTLNHVYSNFYTKPCIQWFLQKAVIYSDIYTERGASTLSSSRFGHVRSLSMKRERERSPLFTVAQSQTATFIAIVQCGTGTDCHIYRHCSLWHRHRLPNAVFSAVFRRLSNVDFYHTRSPVTARRKCCESIFHFSPNLFLLKCNNHLKLIFALIGQKTFFRHDKILSVLQCL